MAISQKVEVKPGEVRCPRCHGRDIVPSKPRGIIDDFMIFGLGRIPRHCRRCEKRFYVDRARCADVPVAEEDHEPTA